MIFTTSITSLNGINPSVFAVEMQRVYCDLRNGLLNIM